mmetsp:Transcript_41355/g.87684  ORF Transcript_41355/g.87684 Transcript_41355/m.87684 type:complete len:416 (-) Transcript_41355:391-1638(-)
MGMPTLAAEMDLVEVSAPVCTCGHPAVAGAPAAAEAGGFCPHQHHLEADEAMMRAAAHSANAGVALGHGGPFGAAVVRDGIVLSCAHNTVLKDGDPTCHAEMNAIRQACRFLQSHDLSDCELYTTCEPCPMCWGAIQWARLERVCIGVDRHTAAEFGFDDKAFYDEVDRQAGHYNSNHALVDLFPTSSDTAPEGMLKVHDGLLAQDILDGLFLNPRTNKTIRRRGPNVAQGFSKVFEHVTEPKRTISVEEVEVSAENHELGMRAAAEAAMTAARQGLNKEREPFGSALVDRVTGEVVASSCNAVVMNSDATATSEIQCIRLAAAKLDTYDLSSLIMYTTSEPDLMSLGAILWARIPHAYVGVSQKTAAQCGFEEGVYQYQSLLESKPQVPVAKNVAFDECADVFKRWQAKNGKIY